jgi:hypothetical protein
MLCDGVNTYLIVRRALKPICQVDSEKVERAMDRGPECSLDLLY